MVDCWYLMTDIALVGVCALVLWLVVSRWVDGLFADSIFLLRFGFVAAVWCWWVDFVFASGSFGCIRGSCA